MEAVFITKMVEHVVEDEKDAAIADLEKTVRMYRIRDKMWSTQTKRRLDERKRLIQADLTLTAQIQRATVAIAEVEEVDLPVEATAIEKLEFLMHHFLDKPSNFKRKCEDDKM